MARFNKSEVKNLEKLLTIISNKYNWRKVDRNCMDCSLIHEDSFVKLDEEWIEISKGLLQKIT